LIKILERVFNIISGEELAAIEKIGGAFVAVLRAFLLFGLIGLSQMPYQLSPDVTVPEIEVRTVWPGATPYEIERDIIEEQEKALKGIPGLTEMESSSLNSQGSVTLRFTIGTEVDKALLRVSNKLNEVPSYPENVEKPVSSPKLVGDEKNGMVLVSASKVRGLMVTNEASLKIVGVASLVRKFQSNDRVSPAFAEKVRLIPDPCVGVPKIKLFKLPGNNPKNGSIF